MNVKQEDEKIVIDSSRLSYTTHTEDIAMPEPPSVPDPILVVYQPPNLNSENVDTHEMDLHSRKFNPGGRESPS